MSLVTRLNGNLLRYPFYSVFNRAPRNFSLQVERGCLRVENPLPPRAGLLFFRLLAFARETQEIELRVRTLLRSLPVKLFAKDLEGLLSRLGSLRLSFEGSFFAQGKFVSRKDLRLVEEIRLPKKGNPLYVRFSPWLFEDTLPLDIELFEGLPPLARRFYLYFIFALWRGAFLVGEEHLLSIFPVITPFQRKRVREELEEIFSLLTEAGVLEVEKRASGFWITPGQHFEELKNTPPSLLPRNKTSSGLSRHLLILGRGHCGKTTLLKRLAKAQKKKGFETLYLPCLYSLTDWLAMNFASEEYKGLSMMEKRALLIEASRSRFVLVDDLERVTAQKEQVIKECLRKAPRFAATASFYQAIPEGIRLTLEYRGFRERHLKSATTRDLTFAVLAVLVVLAAFLGHHEWILGLLAARLLLRQPM